MPGHARTGGRDVIFAWEQCKLKNKAEIVRGASPRPISNPKWFDDNSNVGWLRISDVTEQKGRIHHLSQRISKAGQSKTRVITEPHLLLSIAATVGSPVINYVNTGVHDGFLIFLNPTFDKEFMFQWLLMFKPYWNKYGQPGSQVNLNSDIVGNQSVAFPTTSEQERIGSFFRKLDRTITLHEEKKHQLERLKSALLQKMFADKSGYPPVRFEGFSDKWEQVKYGEIFQRRSKMGVSTPTLPSVEYDDINPGMGTLNKEPKSKGISKRGIYFNPGDVLFGKLRPYLKNWLFACFEGVAVGDFWVLTSSKIDHGFTYSLIQTPGFQYIANLSSGSKMPRSDWGLVSNARTFIPINHLEQERISSVLFGLDHAITLYEHKLEILNQIKSFLLQNMFI
ncbi:restriction endonuclease subunit S [Lactobacillus delbrueckii subsp. bulgaricus]|nr:hypothetical protein [Lactobacillus delbrueckii subsp. bulgaricus]MBT9062239.1 hypothetical protein [Lactobacillus delbrueckii subsp. bulgaricus]MBT9063679.1 hypothetical protein [Lactobacillus delbrueckii subsp. bulgaricus]MBT9070347.1 hypothetical protein [Lactobacillus delbrueckii subsp. bulgaricus]